MIFNHILRIIFFVAVLSGASFLLYRFLMKKKFTENLASNPDRPVSDKAKDVLEEVASEVETLKEEEKIAYKERKKLEEIIPHKKRRAKSSQKEENKYE